MFITTIAFCAPNINPRMKILCLVPLGWGVTYVDDTEELADKEAASLDEDSVWDRLLETFDVVWYATYLNCGFGRDASDVEEASGDYKCERRGTWGMCFWESGCWGSTFYEEDYGVKCFLFLLAFTTFNFWVSFVIFWGCILVEGLLVVLHFNLGKLLNFCWKLLFEWQELKTSCFTADVSWSWASAPRRFESSDSQLRRLCLTMLSFHSVSAPALWQQRWEYWVGIQSSGSYRQVVVWSFAYFLLILGVDAD